jgi:uncharacterized membrane protein
MRAGVVVVGIVLVVIGAVLMFVPVVGQGSQKVDSSSSTPYDVFSVSGFSLTGSIPVSVAWTSTAAVTIVAAACSASCNTGDVSGISGLTEQTGTSGSFTLNQPDGGEVLVGVVSSGSGSPATATFSITTALTTVGSILLVLGIVILIVGVVLRSKSKAASMPPAEPAGQMADAPNPPA